MSDTKQGAYWAENGYGLQMSNKRAERSGAYQTDELKEYYEALAETALAQTDLTDVTDSWLVKAADAADVADRAAEALAQMQDGGRSWADGMETGFAAYVESIGTMADGLEQAVSGSLHSLENTLVEFASTGKASVEDMVTSILADLARLTIQQNITGPLAEAIGNIDWSGIFSGGSTEFAYRAGSHYHADGGLITGPGSETSDSIPSMLSNNEYVSQGVFGAGCGN